MAHGQNAGSMLRRMIGTIVSRGGDSGPNPSPDSGEDPAGGAACDRDRELRTRQSLENARRALETSRGLGGY